MASKPSASGRDLAKRARSMRKPGSAATPPEYWNWWLMKRSAGWERLNGRHGRGLCLDWERS